VTNELKLDKTALKVCLYRDVWHTILSEGKRPYLEKPAPVVHNYDIDENPLDEQSTSSDEGDDTNLQIRNSPIQPIAQLMQEPSKGKGISLTIPRQTVATVKSTTSMKPPTQQTIQQITSQLANMTTTQTTQTAQTAQTTTSTQAAPTTTTAAASTIPAQPPATA